MPMRERERSPPRRSRGLLRSARTRVAEILQRRVDERQAAVARAAVP